LGRGSVALPSVLARGHRETITAAISTTARSETMDRLERGCFDCMIIGGGISGAGIARAAARRGQSVALLESEDFGSGTSGRSSKLIHGGLRYLAMGDVALVRTTALERKEIQHHDNLRKAGLRSWRAEMPVLWRARKKMPRNQARSGTRVPWKTVPAVTEP
jgi:glycine/D-amino acid oxidase-like deaminating enzyme